MAIQFDVGELSSTLAKLRFTSAATKLATVLPISPAKREVARDFLAERPPFDIQAIGLDSHEVFLTENEAGVLAAER